jgi:hypothetical protein
MTLVIAVTGRTSAWLCADRRLSTLHQNGSLSLLSDRAIKVCRIEADDGFATIGYAGLGRTQKGTEPSDWISSSLRGTTGTVEQYLGAISTFAREEFEPHLKQGVEHLFVVSALVSGEPRIYGIAASRDVQGKLQTNLTRFGDVRGRNLRIGLAGSGAPHLSADKENWQRPLLVLVRGVDEGRTQPTEVARYLASLNARISRSSPDIGVGPNAIVSWYSRAHGTEYYEGTKMVPGTRSDIVPEVGRGLAVGDLIDALFPHIDEAFTRYFETGDLSIDRDTVERDAKKVPTKPNRKLR